MPNEANRAKLKDGTSVANPNHSGLPNKGLGNSASSKIFESRDSIKARSVRNTKAPESNKDIRKNPGYSGSN